MNYQKKTVRDIDVKGKKVLLRCDFNVPQDKKTGEITSDKRIVAALPTIRYLLEQGAAVIACSHLGKPEPDYDKWVKKQTEKGKAPAELTEEAWEKSLKKLTLAPVAARLAELLGQEVLFAHDVVGKDAQEKAAALQPGQVLLLENTRFEKGETKVLCACDLSGRDYLGWAVELPASKVGTFDTELAKEFWLAFVRNCPASIHIRQMAGENTHHILEAVFKGMGRTLKQAVSMDAKHLNDIPSTKGTL